jgi:thiamine biosynthesis lipoprotein
MSNRVLIPLDLSEPPALPPGLTSLRLSGNTMGTTWSVQALAPATLTSSMLEQQVLRELDLVIGQMSTWQKDSVLSRFNQAPAGSWHVLPNEFMHVLDAARSMAIDSGGAYDACVGALVNAWGFGPDHERTQEFAGLPAPQILQAARQRCGWRRLELDRASARLLQPGGLYLDFSGIAKGYAVDLVAAAMAQAGCPSYLVEIGGELRGYGVKPDGQPWWVTLERPPGEPGAQPLVVALHGLAVATSGDYRRFFERDGQRYAHTIDPRSGLPLSHDVVSVTVLHAQCMVADALATALQVLGEVEGMAFARARNIAALFIRRSADGFVESMTPAMAAMLD